jgi:hypothetical protein
MLESSSAAASTAQIITVRVLISFLLFIGFLFIVLFNKRRRRKVSADRAESVRRGKRRVCGFARFYIGY